ncbi:MAG: MFS transporter [Candidatus Yanofskybacteria bacterium]|nr:MFS transporter [Candidatus Yanofskybacteria bacterium]
MINVFLLGITSLLADLSSEMVVPVLPFFIQTLGGGGVAIGLIFGVGDAVAALLRVFSGYIADRTKAYKAVVVAGYGVSALLKFGYVTAASWTQIAWVRPAERVGKGLRDAPRDAIISESVPVAQRGRAFGVQRAMDAAGALLGAGVVLVLFVLLEVPFRAIFIGSAVVGLAAVVPLVFVRVPERLRLAQRSVSFAKLTPKVRRFIAVATLFAFANISVAFFVLAGQSSFPNLSGTRALGLTLVAYIILHLVDALASTPAGTLSDRIGRRRTIIFGYLLFAVVCGAFWFFNSITLSAGNAFLVLALLFALIGIARAFMDATQRAFIADMSPEEIRGTALGTFETLTGLAAIPAGLIAGALWNIDDTLPFLYGMAVAAFAALMLVWAMKTDD